MILELWKVLKVFRGYTRRDNITGQVDKFGNSTIHYYALGQCLLDTGLLR